MHAYEGRSAGDTYPYSRDVLNRPPIIQPEHGLFCCQIAVEQSRVHTMRTNVLTLLKHSFFDNSCCLKSQFDV